METQVLVTACLLGIVLWLARTRSRSRSLPPGPPADPFIGHLRIIPTEKVPDKFHEWRKTYGDVIYLEVPGRKMVVLGSLKAAQAILDNRSTNYSCRPKFPLLEFTGFRDHLALMQYGKSFLKHRRVFQQYFGAKESLAFNHTIAEEAQLLVKNLIDATSGTHRHFVHRYAVSNIMRTAFGHQIKSDDDVLLEIANGISDFFRNCGPAGNTPIDVFPWLHYLPSWFPGTHYATFARSKIPTVRRLYDVPLEIVRETMRIQNYEKCFASEKLQELGDNPNTQDLEDIKNVGAAIFVNGGDTNYVMLLWFYLAMVLHPECQKRAYEEIVSVVGESVLPDSNDRGSLPYVECIVQEVHRWNVIAPFGVPHRAIDGDVYNGMFIPKGTMVIPNLRGMSLDEDVYSNPKAFDPSRFLPKPEGKGEPRFVGAWGFGRRICPGRHFADLVIWHAIVCTLATLEIIPKTDEMGNPKLPEVAFTEGFACEPLPFEFDVLPRSAAAMKLIDQ
ncbi:hypothetical protein PM082_007506 [Marasmius tenuissimus]|nr:hypothetical protein PM082_007506 [Marasmius tenuissimus]